MPGLGHYIHTYEGDGDVLPSFEGEPVPVIIDVDDIDYFTSSIWNSLDEGNKVSLYVCFTDLATGQRDVRLVNKNTPMRSV